MDKALKGLLQQYSALDWVVDIVGVAAVVESFAVFFEQTGFRKYTVLYRMNRLKNLDEPQMLDKRVMYAHGEHVYQIHDLLECYFDKYSERIPLVEEIEKWVNKNNVLVITDQQNVIGFLIFEITGVTSYLRYWFTHPDGRDNKIGSALQRRFFHECRHTKRQLFWVINTNENAIMRYKHYGFEAEQLYCQVMIKHKQ
ncbi:hypothetical protein FACS1894121_1720 [Bacteroidia bacterium]|nr:hypothetical protein FACS1894121_1720 [Bacteroidia bacterium]